MKGYFHSKRQEQGGTIRVQTHVAGTLNIDFDLTIRASHHRIDR